MRRPSAIIALLAATAAAVSATSYLGSVVNSWDGRYEGSSYPLSLAYGDGYIWLGYHTFFTQRIAATGSVVDVIGFSGFPGDGLGYEKATKYLYFACSDKGVCCREATSGSTVSSFGLPPGATYLMALDFYNGNPTVPLWLGDLRAWRLWNLTSTGSVVRSLRTSYSVGGVAYDGDTAGGPYIFAGTRNPPPTIYALAPSSGSVLYSFEIDMCKLGIGGLSWDGTYLWTLDDMGSSPLRGMVYQIVAHEPNTAVVPASLGRIKALYR
ncbi:MAG: hypothetical protein JSU81_02710 [Candidatus Coatesbacteria bacterium]|nr:MAG: hypothetical protein JSU81_02710 [Candidatus Coatesbacteria bacterium]